MASLPRICTQICHVREGPHQYMRLKWVAMKMPGPHVGQALRNRCTFPESSTCSMDICHEKLVMRAAAPLCFMQQATRKRLILYVNNRILLSLQRHMLGEAPTLKNFRTRSLIFLCLCFCFLGLV